MSSGMAAKVSLPYLRTEVSSACSVIMLPEESLGLEAILAFLGPSRLVI